MVVFSAYESMILFMHEPTVKCKKTWCFQSLDWRTHWELQNFILFLIYMQT